MPPRLCGVSSHERVDCLVVDDEQALSESTVGYFNLFDVSTAWVASAAECLAFLQTHEVSLVLLDINLDGDSGFELCKRLRDTTDVPILFISARSSDDDVLLALGLGGDDYIAKPYALSVLLAKVKAVLRRYGPSTQAADEPEADLVRFGEYRADLAARRVWGPSGEVTLTAMEFRLLAHLLCHRGRTVTKTELFTQVWGSPRTGDGTLNVHVSRLREKLDPDSRWITTVWGTGYRFENEA